MDSARLSVGHYVSVFAKVTSMLGHGRRSKTSSEFSQTTSERIHNPLTTKMRLHGGSSPATARLITALMLIGGVWLCANGHSWLHCTDYEVPEGHDFYTLPELLDRFNEAKCRGFPRSWNKEGSVFGVEPNEFGRNDLRNITQGESVCGPVARRPGTNLADFYTDDYPMAVYTPGQRVCMVWPSKSHRSMNLVDTSTGKTVLGGDPINLPDGGLNILRSEVNPEKDDEIEDITERKGSVSKVRKERLVSFLGKSKQGKDDMKGFGNCPVFAMHKYTVPILRREEVGLDPCGQCFIVPNLEAGIYTFYWHWKFNNKVEGFNIGPNDLDEEYVTCFDVEITPGKIQTCSLAGDGGMYPGNKPGTGREQKPGNPPPSEPGYAEGGPIDEKSVEPCDPASVKPAPSKKPSPPKKSRSKRGPPKRSRSKESVKEEGSPAFERSAVDTKDDTVPASRIEKIKRIAKTGNEGGR